MRLQRDAALGLAAILVSLGVWLITGPGTGPHRHVGWLVLGVASVVFSLALPTALLFERRPGASESHRARLQTMLFNCQIAIDARQGVGFADPTSADPQHRAFRAHFPSIGRRLKQWNAAVAQVADARSALSHRFEREVADRGLGEPPYRGEVLAADLGHVTRIRARVSRRQEPLPLEFGPGSMWRGYVGSHRPPEGLPPAGIQVANSPNWCVDMTGVSDEDYKERAQELLDPVNALLIEAQSWPETVELEAAEEALTSWDRAPVLAEIEEARAQTEIKHSRRCPECRRQR
jgi:hypothetical protein